MANIESKNLLVAVKAYSRGNPLPLDASEIYDSKAAAEAYAKEANAYAGQTIKVLEDGEYKSYVLQPGSNGLVLKAVGAIQTGDLSGLREDLIDYIDGIKDSLIDYVQVVNTLPTTGEEKVIYLVGTEVKDDEGTVTDTKWTGSIWIADGESGKYEEIFKDSKDIEKSIEDAVSALTPTLTKLREDVDKNAEAIEDINDTLATKANIENPVFIGTVKVKADDTISDEDAEEVAVKSYVDGLIAGIHSNTPKVVNSENPLPTNKYKAGNTWRVSEAGTYAGQTCEVGDVIICLNDYKADGASDLDFLVVQANIDGAVTNREEAVVDTEIAIFDGVTGKVIKSSKITLSSLTTVIADSHTHTNKTQLDTYNKTQTELLAEAATTAQGKVDALKTNTIDPIFNILPIKDDNGTKTFNGYTKEETNDLLDAKADADSVYTKTETDKLINDEISDITKILPITGEGEDKALNVYTKEEIDAVIGAEGSLTANVNTKTTMKDVKEYIGEIETDTVKEYIDNNVGKLDNGGTIVDYINEKIGTIPADGDGQPQTVKDYVDAGLAEKADKSDIIDAYTKTETDGKITNAVSAAKSELQGSIDGKVAQGDFNTLNGKVTTLIGTDTDKSVRSIAAEEIAAKLIAEDATESLDTLEEIAAWIQSHPNDASSINAAILALQKQLQGIDAGEGTVKKYVDDAVASKDLSAYATKEYVDTQDTATLKTAKEYADSAVATALTIVRF